MSKIRRLFVPVAIAWLFLHVGVVTGTVLLLITTGASENEIVCRCAHGGDHESCPMHRKAADSARCLLQSSQKNFSAGLIPMLGPLTLPVMPAAFVADRSTSVATASSPHFPANPAVPPEPRPHRI